MMNPSVELVALSVLVFMLRTQDLRIIKTNMPKLMGISRCQSVYGVYGTNIASGNSRSARISVPLLSPAEMTRHMFELFKRRASRAGLHMRGCICNFGEPDDLIIFKYLSFT